MRTGPKALVGLGLPVALRAITPSKGGGVPAPPQGFLFVARVRGDTVQYAGKPGASWTYAAHGAA